MYKMYIERQRGEEIDRYIDTDIDIYIYNWRSIGLFKEIFEDLKNVFC